MGKVFSLFLELPWVELTIAEVIGDVFLLIWLLGKLGEDALMLVILFFFLLVLVVFEADD